MAIQATVHAEDTMTFKKGEISNPTGPKKGMAYVAKMIFERTQSGRELVEWALTVWKDTGAPMADRRWAFEWLSDRCMGKAVGMNLIAVGAADETGKPKRNIRALSESAIAIVDAVFRESEGLPPIDVPEGVLEGKAP